MAKRGKECAETCLELMFFEMVKTYTSGKAGLEEPSLAMEAIGYRVGRQFVEGMVTDRQRFGDHLEVIKFICKEFWAELFQKQVDNLKTNHRGVFVLQDNRFRWLHRLSPETTGLPKAQAAEVSAMYLHFPCGIIRGALCALGVNCTVMADPTNIPGCAFTIRTNKS